MTDRKPQINFQVEPGVKQLYEEAKISGLRVTRLCAAGLLLMVEDAQARLAALDRLRAWETKHADVSPAKIRAFVQRALRSG